MSLRSSLDKTLKRFEKDFALKTHEVSKQFALSMGAILPENFAISPDVRKALVD